MLSTVLCNSRNNSNSNSSNYNDDNNTNYNNDNNDRCRQLLCTVCFNE